jgi:hypothetical protein
LHRASRALRWHVLQELCALYAKFRLEVQTAHDRGEAATYAELARRVEKRDRQIAAATLALPQQPARGAQRSALLVRRQTAVAWRQVARLSLGVQTGSIAETGRVLFGEQKRASGGRVYSLFGGHAEGPHSSLPACSSRQGFCREGIDPTTWLCAGGAGSFGALIQTTRRLGDCGKDAVAREDSSAGFAVAAACGSAQVVVAASSEVVD